MQFFAFNIEGQDWIFDTEGISEFKIKNLNFKEKYGFELRQMSVAKLQISHNFFDFNDLHIVSGHSEIKTDLNLSFKDFQSFKEFGQKVKFKTDLKSAKLNIADLVYFIPTIHTNKLLNDNIGKNISLSGKISGTLNNFSSSGFSINVGRDFNFQSDFNLKNISHKGKEYIALKNAKLKTSADFISGAFKTVNFGNKFTSLGSMIYSGSFEGSFRDFVTKGTFISKIGRADININTKFEKENKNVKYKGLLTLQDFDAGSFLGDEKLGKIGGKINLINGYDIFSKKIKAEISAGIDSFEYKGYKYRNADVKAFVESKRFNGDMKLKDGNVDFNLSGIIDFTDTLPIFNLNSKFKNVDLFALNLYKRKLNISGDISLDFMGSNPDNFEGFIKSKNLIATNYSKEIKIDSINISSYLNDNGERYLDFDSDIGSMYFDGEYKLKYLYSAVYNMFDRHFNKFISGTIHRQDTISGDFSDYYYDFSIEMDDSKDLVEILTGKKMNFQKLSIFGNAEHYKDSLIVELKFDKFAFGDNYLKDFSANFNLFKGYGDFHLNSKGAKFGKSDIGEFNFDSDVDQDELYFQFAVDSIGKNVDMVAFSGKTEPYIDSFGVEIYGGFLTALENELEFAGQNKIVIGKNYINLEDFVLNDEKGKLRFEDFNHNKGVRINLKNIDVSIVDFLMKYKKLKFSGISNGYVAIPDIFKTNYFESRIKIPNLKINDDYYGVFESKVEIDSTDRTKLDYNATLGDELKILRARGFYKIKEKVFFGNYDLLSFPISFLENIINSGISETRGRVDGNLRVYGPFKNISISGNGIVHNGETKVDYLGVKYYFDKQKFIINDNGIDFTGVKITDKFGNEGFAKGGITYSRFRDWGVDVTLVSDKILGLNTTKKQNPDYWGVGIGKVEATFSGKFADIIKMDINTKTDKGTELTIPVKLYVNAEGESFVKFNTDTTGIEIKKKSTSESKISVEFNVDITQDAKLTIIMDENAGDNLAGKGEGKIRLLVKEDGEIDMYGDYKFFEGKYLFTLYKVVNKEFAIRSGSSINWSGDPFDAIMDIKADYSGSKISLKNLLSEYNEVPGANYKADVNLILNLQGSLSKPEINFNFDFTNVDEKLKTYIVSKMQRLNSDVNALNTQVVGIMVFGSFLPDENIGATITNSSLGSTGQSAFYNTVSEFLVTKLSGYLTGLLSEIITDSNVISGIDISFDSESNTILSTGQSTDAGSYLPQYLNMNATLWFFDNQLKVQFGGGYTGKSDIATRSNFFSGENINMEFYLTEDKRLKIRLFFNRDYNEFNNEWEVKSGFGLGYERGFGRIYKEEK